MYLLPWLLLRSCEEDLRGASLGWGCREETSDLAFWHRGRLQGLCSGRGCAGPSAGRAAAGLLPGRRKPGGGGGLPGEAGTSLLRCHPRGPGPTGGCRRRRPSQPAVICINRQTTEGLSIATLSSPPSPLGLTRVSTQPAALRRADRVLIPAA